MNRRSFWVVMRNSLMREMEYRSHYFILVFSTFISILMEGAVFKQLYVGKSEIGGLPAALALNFVVLGAFLRGAFAVWQTISEYVDEIREGSFRNYLMRPLHFPTYFFSQLMGQKVFVFFIGALGLWALRSFFGFQGLVETSSLGPFVVAVGLSFLLTFQIYLSILYVGFWTEDANFLMIAFNIGVGIFSGSLLPLTWLPPLLEKALRWSFFPLLGDFPLRAGLGLLAEQEFQSYCLQCLFWIVFFLLLNNLLWRQGTKGYESYGA